MDSKQIPLHKSLSYTQAKYGVISALVLGTVFSFGQIVLDYYSLNDEIGSSVENMVTSASSSASLAVYNLDTTNARQIVRGLVNYPAITDASIIDDFGNELGTAAGQSQVDISSLARLLFGGSEQQRYGLRSVRPADTANPLADSLQEVTDSSAELRITVDNAMLADTFIQRSAVVLLSGIARNFILALILLYVFHRAITQAIIFASNQLRSEQQDKQIPLSPKHEENEFGVLINAFNDHISTIESQRNEIIETNEHLEELVDVRTAQLDFANKELEKEKAVAVEASQSKSDFLAMMSHEMRTPMNGILGMVELLGKRYSKKNASEMSAAEKEEQEYLEAITDSSNSLLTLMNSVLDYSKYEKGKMEFDYHDFDIHRLLNGVVFLLSTVADQRDNSLSLDIADEVPKFLVGDAEKLRQILINLVSNAIKFTESGSIVVRVTTEDPATDTKEEGVRLKFLVEDSGIGIPEEARSRIFDPFTQAGSSISSRFGGTGLGLAICKQIIERQDGEISLDSVEGEGTRVTFLLGFNIGQQPEQQGKTEKPEEPTTQSPKLSVLVVDDLEINRKLARGQLENEGHDVFLASDGSEALDIVERQAIDVILMDLFMPVMDGIETTEALREKSNQEVANIPIIGVTANLNEETKTSCIEAGMDAVTAKPLTGEKLFRLFAEVGLADAKQATISETANGEEELLDKSMLDAHASALGAEQLNTLFKEAESSAHDYVEKMQAALDNEDYATLESHAHALAGLGANFGLLSLRSVALSIENDAPNNNKDDLQSLVAELITIEERSFSALWELQH